MDRPINTKPSVPMPNISPEEAAPPSESEVQTKYTGQYVVQQNTKPMQVPETKSEEDWEKDIAEARKDAETPAEEPKEPEMTVEEKEIAELEAKLAAAKKKAIKKAAKAKSKPIKPTPAPKEETPVVESTPVAEEPVKEETPKTEEPAKEKPTENDIAAEHMAIAARNNAANRVFTDNGTDEELDDLLVEIDAEDTRDANVKSENPSEGAIALALCSQIGQRTKQQRMMNRFITELAEEKKEHYQPLEEGSLRIAKINPKASGTGKLTGEAAKIAVISRAQGLYRIMLYNSGFWITIKPMTVVDASAFVHEVDADFKELGRILGGQFHLVLGAYLKHKVLEILPNMIVSSNLNGWEDGGTLGEAISYQDYDTILWGICCSMYRDGIGIGVHCTNKDCRYIDPNQYVDLTKACFINPNVFNTDAMGWMRDTRTTRTLSDCIHYRNTILNGKRAIEVGKDSVFTLKVPSLQCYAKRSIELITKMETAIYNSRNKKNEELMNQITFHLYKMLAPWVQNVVYKNEDGTTTEIDEFDAICTALEVQPESDNTCYDKIEAFIRDTKCTMYCLTSIECPKCHKKPHLNDDGVFPLDVEYLFFGLSCLRLEQTGIEL